MLQGPGEKIDRDKRSRTTPRERFVFYTAVVLISMALFGSLYTGIRFLE